MTRAAAAGDGGDCSTQRGAVELVERRHEVVGLDGHRSRREIVVRGRSADAFAGQPQLSREVVPDGALQTAVSVVAEPFGETNDGAAARAGASRHLGDRTERDRFRIVEHDRGDATLGRRQCVASLLEPVAHGHGGTTYPVRIALEWMFRISLRLEQEHRRAT